MARDSRIKLHPLAERMLANSESMLDIEQNSFESATILYLLGEFGIEKQKYELLREFKRRTGESKLRLAVFNDHFPTFPLTLSALVIPKIGKDSSLSLLMNKMPERKAFKAWVEQYEAIPSEDRHRPFGLIVRWPFIQRGMLIHNMSVQHLAGTRLTWRLKGLTLSFEPLPQLMRYLKKTWEP